MHTTKFNRPDDLALEICAPQMVITWTGASNILCRRFWVLILESSFVPKFLALRFI